MLKTKKRLKVLLTGGTGFLGKAFIRYLNSKNFDLPYDITVISSGRTKFEETIGVQYIKLDLTNPSSARVLRGSKYDILIHLATSSTNGPLQEDYKRYKDILAIDQSVLKIANYVGCKKVIWASSGAVYGEISSIYQTKESNEIILRSIEKERPYRIGKIQSEFHAQVFCKKYGINLEILRLFAFSGLDLPLHSHFAFGNFILNALTENSVVLNGAGLATRSYLDQHDLAEILSNIIICNSPPLRILNVGAKKAYKLIEVAEVISDCYEKLSGKKCKIIVKNNFDDRNNFYVPDTAALRKEIGDFEAKSISTSAEEMLKYYIDKYSS